MRNVRIGDREESPLRWGLKKSLRRLSIAPLEGALSCLAGKGAGPETSPCLAGKGAGPETSPWLSPKDGG